MGDIARLSVEIDDVSPRVVRVVEVPVDIRLDDLHFVLQIAIGWQNGHPFEFRIGDNAMTVGLEGQVGQVAAGQLADIIVLDKDPIADIAILQDAKNLSHVIKDGKIVDLDPRDEMLMFQQAAE